MSILEIIKALEIKGIQVNNPLLKKELTFIDQLNERDATLLKQRLATLRTLDDTAWELKKQFSDNKYMAALNYPHPKPALSSIAKEFDLSREGVRKFVPKAKERMSETLIELGYPEILFLIKSYRFGLSDNEIKKYLSSENYFLIGLLQESLVGLKYIKEFNYYFTEKENGIFTEIKSMLDNMADPILLDDVQTKVAVILSHYFEEQGQKEIQEIVLSVLGFKKLGIYISRSNISDRKKLEILFERHINIPLKMDSKGADYLNDICFRIFGSSLQVSTKTIYLSVRLLKKVILVAPKTYQLLDEEILADPIWKDISLFIDKRFKYIDYINAETIFIGFEKKLERIDVKNKFHLYSLIKKLFNNRYQIGKGNTLNVYKKGRSKKRIEEVLEEIIINSDGDMKRSALVEKANWKLHKLDSLVSSSPKFILWDNDIVKLTASLNISELVTEKMYNFINSHMQLGFSTTVLLFEKFQTDAEMSKVLLDCEISSSYVLGSIIKKLYPDINGNTILLYRSCSKNKSIQDVLSSAFSDTTSNEEIIQYLINLGYSKRSANQITYLFNKQTVNSSENLKPLADY